MLLNQPLNKRRFAMQDVVMKRREAFQDMEVEMENGKDNFLQRHCFRQPFARPGNPASVQPDRPVEPSGSATSPQTPSIVSV